MYVRHCNGLSATAYSIFGCSNWNTLYMRVCMFVCLYKRRAELKTQFRLWTHWMKFYMRYYHICCHFVVNHCISMTLILVLARSFMFVAFLNMSSTERTYFVWKCFNVYFIHFGLDSHRLYEKVQKKKQPIIQFGIVFVWEC